MKRILTILLLLAAPSFAQEYVGVMGSETNGAVLPLAVEARIAAGESAAATSSVAIALARGAVEAVTALAETAEPLWTAASNRVLYVGDIASVAYGTGTNEAYRGDWGAAVSNWGDWRGQGFTTTSAATNIAQNVASNYVPLYNGEFWSFIETGGARYLFSDDGFGFDFSNGDVTGAWNFTNGIVLGGVTRTDWPQGTILGATINEPHTVSTNDGILVFTVTADGSGTPTTNAFAGLPSILVSADWTWTNSIYAVGADTSSTNIAVTLPDAGTNFVSVIIRKFSNLNNLEIKRGTNVVYTLYDDGSARAYDWWPQRTNWYWRN